MSLHNVKDPGLAEELASTNHMMPLLIPSSIARMGRTSDHCLPKDTWAYCEERNDSPSTSSDKKCLQRFLPLSHITTQHGQTIIITFAIDTLLLVLHIEKCHRSLPFPDFASAIPGACDMPYFRTGVPLLDNHAP